jgi:YbbR domain-containing protein
LINKRINKFLVGILSLIISCVLFFSVNTLGVDNKDGISFTSTTEGVYVIEDLKIDYKYDKLKYEVVPFIIEPYAVIKGDKQLINLLKWSDKPEFYIDLIDKLPGTYREEVKFKGINKQLKVEIFPGVVDLRLMEQQTVKLEPVIELEGSELVDKDYIVGVPELLKSEVMIRDIQDKLNLIGQVKGKVNVSEMTATEDVEVELTVYDRNGKLMSDINLLDRSIFVRIPIEKKITVIKEEVVKEIIVIEEIIKEVPVKETPIKETPVKEIPIKKTPVKEPLPVKENPVVVKPPVKEGTLFFINIPKDLLLENKTGDLKWSSDIKIDLSGFKEGIYEMTVSDNGIKKTVKFELKSKVVEENVQTEESEG